MDKRLTATHGIWQPFLAAIVALALVMTLGATSASAASPSACRVQNTVTSKTYTVLQAAVDAAKKDDRLTVRGTCHGTTVISRDLVIEGVLGRGADRPLLDGDGRGVVLTVKESVAVTVTDLTIRGGRGLLREGGPRTPWLRPAGVENGGMLTLQGVTVRRNVGLGVHNTGTLLLRGDTRIDINGANEHVGVVSTGTLRLNGTATIRQNNVAVRNWGTLVLDGSSSLHNNSLAIENLGTATLNDNSRIDDFAWGVRNAGTLTLNDSSKIRGLYRPVTRGYVGVTNSGTLTLNARSRITDNGIGVDNTGTLTLNDTGQVSGNQTGVANTGHLTLNGSSAIRDNHRAPPLDCYGSNCSAPAVGAGVTNTGTVVMNDSSTISGNTLHDSRNGSYGGGVHMMRDPSLPEPPSLTMTGSATISGNSASDKGGGICASADSILSGVNCGPQTLANVYGNTPDDCHVEP